MNKTYLLTLTNKKYTFNFKQERNKKRIVVFESISNRRTIKEFLEFAVKVKLYSFSIYQKKEKYLQVFCQTNLFPSEKQGVKLFISTFSKNKIEKLNTII